MSIENQTLDLIKKAIREYGDAITPLTGLKGLKTWEECFIVEGDHLVLYFNIPSAGHTTRSVRVLIKKE